MRDWRLLDKGFKTAVENMALDDVILECHAGGLVPNTVRFLQFSPPAVLVGYHQVVEQEVRTEYCETRGIDINRRLTGGGAILFDSTSLGWEIIASKAELAYSATFNKTKMFEEMSRGALLGLRSLGIPASFRPKNDIEVNGRKISGTGGTERGESFLFQGTLLVDFDVETMLRALKIPVEKLKDKEIESVKERVTWVGRELGYVPSLDKMKKALKAGFEKAFNIRLTEEGLSESEEKLLKRRLPHFRSSRWINLQRRPVDDAAEAYAVTKTPGGLIRVSLSLERRPSLIKNILITGDFFAFPSRAILDLEAKLKGATLDEIRGIIHDFFDAGEILIPSIAPDDIVDLILEAARKTEYDRLGISLAEANHIYTVNGEGVEHLVGDYDFLLLPYCAKLPSCEFRWREGCARCGKCSVGQAYELAEAAGLTPLTIQNFEHLMATLRRLSQQGAKGYIGCCCEGFYCKHQDDFDDVGLPGILVDIDDQTCYDLGLERQALNGTFESQTCLRIGLLSKLVKNFSKGRRRCPTST